MRGRHVLFLAIILVLAVVLRTVGVEQQGLWVDEGLSIVVSRWPSMVMLLEPTEPNPALYYLLHKAFIAPDAPLIVVRSISIIAGVAAVGLMYGLGRAAYGRAAGLIAALLLAVWTAHVDYSQEARAYSLQVTLSLAAALGTLGYMQAQSAGPRRAWLALFAAGNLLAFYTHIVSAPFVAATSLIVVSHALTARRPPVELLAAFAGMALLATPNLLRVFAQLQGGETLGWLSQASAGDFIRLQAEVFLPEGLWDNRAIAWENARLVRWAVVGVFAVGLGFGVLRFGKAMLRQPATALILAYLAMPATLWLLGLVVGPLLMHRAILYAIPGFALLLTGLVVQTRRPAVWGLGLGALYLTSTLLFGLQREKQHFREAAKVLAREARADEIILVCGVIAYPAIRYHAQGKSGSMVLAQSYGDRLLLMEPGGLGADPGWDQTYFVQEIRSSTKADAPQPTARALPLQAGQSLLLVTGHCEGSTLRDPLMRTLAAANLTPHEIWRAKDKHGFATDVSISRMTVPAPAVWQVSRVP